MALRSGRFEEGADAFTQRFGASLPVDKALYAQDIAGSRAHAAMLAAQGVIAQEDAAAIDAGLADVLGQIEAGQFAFDVNDEDIHMAVEGALTAAIGEPGARLHTGRSRNDQVATDTRLYAKKRAGDLMAANVALRQALLAQAEAHFDVILPGYTHLQHAQPVLFSHHLLAYTWMLARDFKRLAAAREAADACPLGAAALAGTTYPLDRSMTAEALGFGSVIPNSLDAVSDRDFLLDLLYACSVSALHLTRLCEEIILWSTAEFGFVTLSDAYSTGSSIMPQKKNPDFAELIRGKSGRVIGDLMALMVTVKSLPLAYNKDLQEDKEGAIDAANTLEDCYRCAAGMIATMQVNPDAIAFPKAKVAENAYDFSFSGVKSAVLNYINGCHMKGLTVVEADIAASFQKAVTDVLIEHAMLAVDTLSVPKFAIAGGVAANGTLRDGMEKACEAKGVEFYYPSPVYCTDNAAMIGTAAYYEFLAGKRDGWDLNAVPNLKLGER